MPNKTNDQNFAIYESVIMGAMLYFLTAWTHSFPALPLFDFYSEVALTRLLPLLAALIMILILFQRKYFKTLIALSLACVSLVTVYRYSTNDAFRYFSLFSFIFALLFKDRKKEERANASILILGFLFILAAIQKMNPNYLAGKEFLHGGPFISFYELWWPNLIPTQWNSALRYLPHFSIFIELALAFGIFIFPRITVHLMAMFLLTLSFVNPPVVFVYFLLLPFFISISASINEFLRTSSLKQFFSSPFFWGFYIYICNTGLLKPEQAFFHNSIFVLILVAFHIFIFAAHEMKQKDSFTFQIPTLAGMRLWIIPFLMVLVYLGSLSFLPSPFGFKMFTGRRLQNSHYNLQISGKEACDYSQKSWVFSMVSDSNFIKSNEETCHILFPTSGGLRYAARQICKEHNNVQFILEKSDEKNLRTLSCSEFQF